MSFLRSRLLLKSLAPIRFLSISDNVYIRQYPSNLSEIVVGNRFLKLPKGKEMLFHDFEELRYYTKMPLKNKYIKDLSTGLKAIPEYKTLSKEEKERLSIQKRNDVYEMLVQFREKYNFQHIEDIYNYKPQKMSHISLPKIFHLVEQEVAKYTKPIDDDDIKFMEGLAHIDDLQYSYNIFSLYCAKPEFKHSPIPVKQRRHDFDRISVEEKLILRKQRMTFIIKEVQNFENKWKDKYAIPAFITEYNEEKTVQNSAFLTDRRIWIQMKAQSKIERPKSKKFSEAQKNEHKNIDEIKKLKRDTHRKRYNFTTKQRASTVIDMYKKWRKENKIPGGTNAINAGWRAMTFDEQAKFFEMNTQFILDYKEQNKLAALEAIAAKDWFAILTTEVRHNGTVQDKRDHRLAWEIFVKQEEEKIFDEKVKLKMKSEN